MKTTGEQEFNRRRFIQGTSTLAGTALLTTDSLLSTLSAFAQDPPSCPMPPSGGTNFVPGSDKRPVTLRKSIEALNSAEITKFRNAFAALRALPVSDKRTWLMQADMHALFSRIVYELSHRYSWIVDFFPMAPRLPLLL